MNILQSLKKITSLSVLGLTLYSVVAGGTGALASGPDFNKLEGDREFTVGRTANQAAYSDPVSATTADRVTIAVYYHNNVTGTTATNVTVQSVLPIASATTHVIHTALRADNATPITDTVVGGQIVGSPDLTINLDHAANVSYVPGSTKWFPDLQQNPDQAGIPMPDGITTSGLNIGSIDGCWSHAGYVLYDVAFSSNAGLETDKWVAVYGGNNVWVKTNTASAGDELRYQVRFGNTGNGTASNVRVVDTLPAHSTYVPGTIIKRTLNAQGNDIDTPISDTQVIFNGQTITIPLGDVLPGQNNSGYLYLRTKIDPALQVGTYMLKNDENTVADNAALVSASATTTVTVTPNPVSDLKLLKEVANVTQGSTRWVKSNTASPLDRMQYRLTVYNQGTAPANNVSVKDTLPQYITYVAGSTKIFTTDPNSGQSLPDGITTTGVSVGSIQNGVPVGNRYIVFDVSIDGSMPAGNTDLVNSSDVFENGVKKDSSTALTTVTSETGLLFTKEVWNASNGQWVTSLNGVKPGDVITYRLMVRNTGNTTVTGIVLKDTVPQFVTYISGSSREDGVPISDAWITTPAGQALPNQTAGNFKIISFQVTVGACPPGGTITLTNLATATADAMPLKTAHADIIVTAGPPNLPR